MTGPGPRVGLKFSSLWSETTKPAKECKIPEIQIYKSIHWVTSGEGETWITDKGNFHLVILTIILKFLSNTLSPGELLTLDILPLFRVTLVAHSPVKAKMDNGLRLALLLMAGSKSCAKYI